VDRGVSLLGWQLRLGKIFKGLLGNWRNSLNVRDLLRSIDYSESLADRAACTSVVAKRKTLFDDRPVEISVSRFLSPQNSTCTE